MCGFTLLSLHSDSTGLFLFLWIIHGSPVEGRLNWDVVLLSRVLGGSRALGRKFFVVPNSRVSDIYDQFLKYFYCKITLLDIEIKSFSLPGFTAGCTIIYIQFIRLFVAVFFTPRSCLVSFYKLTSIVNLRAKTLNQIHFIKMRVNLTNGRHIDPCVHDCIFVLSALFGVCIDILGNSGFWSGNLN